MITLVYHSTSTEDCSTEELINFLSFIRLEKISLNVTGILLYHNNEILHIMEGKTDVILPLFENYKDSQEREFESLLIDF